VLAGGGRSLVGGGDQALGRLLGLADAQGALLALLAGVLLPVAGDLEYRGDLRAGLSADTEPVHGTLGVDLDERGLLGGVVLTDLLDHGPVALLARVDHDDAVVRFTDLAHSLQADLDSHVGGLSFGVFG